MQTISNQTQPLRRLFLLYHELQPAQSQYSYALDVSTFAKHLELFSQVRESRNSSLWPEITFDDGHLSNFEHAAPVLHSRNLTAHFFITVGWTGNRPGYMDWPELRSLQAAGHRIGAHGWTHTLLTHCTEEELQIELSKARLTLEDKLGTSIVTMSLPGGRYNRRILAACERAGYTQVYTSIPKAEPLPLGPTLGRLNIRGDMQLDWIASLFQPDSHVLNNLGRQYRIKAAAKRLVGDRLYHKLWARMNRQEPDAENAGDHGE